MFLLNAEATINWGVPATVSPPALADLDIQITDPYGVITYLDAAIDVADYTPPTPVAAGLVIYRHTPTVGGFWRIRLTIGVEDTYYVVGKVEMWVFDNTQIVKPVRYIINTVPDEKSISIPGPAQLITGTLRWYPTRNITLRSIIPNAGVPSEVYDLEFDVLKNGVTSILASPLRIPFGDNLGIAQVPTISDMTPNDYLTVDVTVIGLVIPGRDIVINFKYD